LEFAEINARRRLFTDSKHFLFEPYCALRELKGCLLVIRSPEETIFTIHGAYGADLKLRGCLDWRGRKCLGEIKKHKPFGQAISLKLLFKESEIPSDGFMLRSARVGEPFTFKLLATFTYTFVMTEDSAGKRRDDVKEAFEDNTPLKRCKAAIEREWEMDSVLVDEANEALDLHAPVQTVHDRTIRVRLLDPEFRFLLPKGGLRPLRLDPELKFSALRVQEAWDYPDCEFHDEFGAQIEDDSALQPY
jgi:hypothetical protein